MSNSVNFLYLKRSWLLISICMNTLLFWNLLTGFHWDFLVYLDTCFSGLLMTLFKWFLGTFGLGYLMTDFFWNINTDFMRDLLTNWICHLSLLGLGHICTLFIWLLSTCSRYWNPNLCKIISLLCYVVKFHKVSQKTF